MLVSKWTWQRWGGWAPLRYWVLRSESSPSPFWTWGSDSDRRIQRSKQLQQTEVLPTGNGRAPIRLWVIRQTVHVFIPCGRQQCDKKSSLSWRVNMLVHCWEFLHLYAWGILVSVFLHGMSLSSLVSGLY